MIRSAGVFLGVFAGVLAILLVAVGQLGKIDRQTLVAVLVTAAVAGGIATWRSSRRER